ncbi:MAG: cation:proton antiporter [Rubrivivax sp.]
MASLALAMSSTAIGLAVFNERNLMTTGAGQTVLSAALFQDIAAIPIFALLPLMAPPARPSAPAAVAGPYCRQWRW